MVGDLQTLPSSLREKQRYIIFELITEADARTLGQVVDATWEAALDLLGETGVAEADPWVIKDLFDEERQRGGIRVHKDAVEEMRAALALITDIGGATATVYILGVTGTMDSARDKYF